MSDQRAWLGPDEVAVFDWVAAVPFGRGWGAKYGGRLFLTSRRVVWIPREVDDAASGEPFSVDLANIVRVEPDARRKALLHIVTRVGGGPKSLLIGAGGFSPLWSKKNRVARDAAVARINQALPGGAESVVEPR